MARQYKGQERRRESKPTTSMYTGEWTEPEFRTRLLLFQCSVLSIIRNIQADAKAQENDPDAGLPWSH